MNLEKSDYSAKVNGHTIDHMSATEEGFVVNDKFYPWDLRILPDGGMHILMDQKNYLVQINSIDYRNKSFSLKINGDFFDIRLLDSFDRLLEKMGMAKKGSTSNHNIYAPMPGQIVELLVEEGEKVNKGDPLLVLKAMKMENILKATADLTIRKILIKKGDPVEKKQELILF